MNKMKQLVALVLLVVLCALGITAFAQEIQPYASALFGSRAIYSSAFPGGVVKFTADVSAIKSIDKLGFSSIKVQEKRGSSWVTVKTVKDKYGYHTSIYDYTVSYGGTTGEDYRAVVVYYAKDGNISDTKTKTSTGITAE